MTIDAKIKEIRDMEGLSRRTTLTIEDIARRIQPKVYEPVIMESADPEYLSEGWQPLD